MPKRATTKVYLGPIGDLIRQKQIELIAAKGGKPTSKQLEIDLKILQLDWFWTGIHMLCPPPAPRTDPWNALAAGPVKKGIRGVK